MREIKFRAWHKNAKYMCNNATTDLLDREWLEFMQYTGLKDKNGKEIYEGDILAREGFWSVRIEWEDSAFMVRDLDIVRYNNLCFNWYLKSFDCSEWEVVGNIYENEDLIHNI